MQQPPWESFCFSSSCLSLQLLSPWPEGSFWFHPVFSIVVLPHCPLPWRMKSVFLNAYKDLAPGELSNSRPWPGPAFNTTVPADTRFLPWMYPGFLALGLCSSFSSWLDTLPGIPNLLMLLHPPRWGGTQNCLLHDSVPEHLPSPPELS